jgi:predicted nucleic acid-binding protein
MDVEKLFLDSNLLVYARDRGEPEKGALAQSLLQRIFAAGMPHISTQVLSEFFWTVTRKLTLPLTAEEAIADTRRLISMSRVLPESIVDQTPIL